MMRKQYLLFLWIGLLTISCQPESKQGKSDEPIQASTSLLTDNSTNKGTTEVLVVPFDAVAEKMADPTAGLRVINFWATWCKPCVAELPYFEKAREKYESKGVSFTLISLDFSEELEKKVIPFVKKKGLKSEVWLLDDIDYNSWIDKVDPEWGGEIPMTVIIDVANGIKHTIPNEITYEELEELIERFLKK